MQWRQKMRASTKGHDWDNAASLKKLMHLSVMGVTFKILAGLFFIFRKIFIRIMMAMFHMPIIIRHLMRMNNDLRHDSRKRKRQEQKKGNK